MTDIMIITPVYQSTDNICQQTKETVNALRDAGIAHKIWMLQPGPEIGRNRNTMISSALNLTDWTHMLCLDADVSLRNPVTDIARMMRQDADVVCGLYEMRRENMKPSLCGWHDGDYVQMDATGQLRGTGAWGGGGCMLVKRSVFETLGAPWFRHIIEGNDETPEDVGFCRYVEQYRGAVVLDCDIRPIHHMEGCVSNKPKVVAEQKAPTVEQLKAAAYDCVAIIEQAQARLRQINAQIAELTRRKE